MGVQVRPKSGVMSVFLAIVCERGAIALYLLETMQYNPLIKPRTCRWSSGESTIPLCVCVPTWFSAFQYSRVRYPLTHSCTHSDLHIRWFIPISALVGSSGANCSVIHCYDNIGYITRGLTVCWSTGWDTKSLITYTHE